MRPVRSVLVFGTLGLINAGCQTGIDPLASCVDVRGTRDPAAPGFIVMYKSEVDPVATTARLESKYGFSAAHVYTALPGFAAQLSPAALTGVRCESSVATISYDSSGGIAAR